MAGKQIPGEGLSASIAGMSKSQLYDIMSQMKTLIEQNQQQAREILIGNPVLTKALFQAQIMLGMVQPPKVIPNIQPAVSQQPQQSAQSSQPSSTIAPPSLPGQASTQDQTGASETQASARKQPQNQPPMPNPSASIPAIIPQTQPMPMPMHPLQTPQQPRGQFNPQGTPVSLPQSAQLPSNPSAPVPSVSQPPPIHPSQMAAASSQLQQPLQTTGVPHMPMQPTLPPQHRPPSAPTFHHQYPPQMGPNFQHPGAQHMSQPVYHSGIKPPASVGPSFPQGQPPLPSQGPSQSLYQAGGSHMGTDFNQVGGMQMDRCSWKSGPLENPTVAQHPGPPPSFPGPMGSGGQPRPPPLTPEMEKALLQQVMSLTPEQINLLPPEQRSQVFQLQQMLRQ